MVKIKERDHVDEFLELEYLGDIPNLDLTVEGIVDRIHDLSKRFKRAHNDTLAEHDLSHGDWSVLNTLARKQPRSAGALAKIVDLSSGAMTNRLDRLEQAGLVRRMPDPDDRRGVLVELTQQGRRTFHAATGEGALNEAFIASALTKREKEELNALLRRMMLEFERREAPAD
jgi:DNA-binding MarR family transcriptional regulator